ncbi:MAG: inosine monophosphate cyclohydrolase [Clostridiaceae bacterium]|nr:inosine monophosphate cyclohydrolase [Clostridiaceae bacterium]
MLREIADKNAKRLKENAYPGRGIVIGKTPDGSKLVQIYWIMGRSANSRNRIFVRENDFVRTKAFDESKITDPSLIIYYPLKVFDKYHIISNGDQTDTVFDTLKAGGTFEEALMTREFEPDAPNFTPRITGIIELNGKNDYSLSIIKTQNNNPEICIRNFYHYEKSIPGLGHCIHTYAMDGEVLPSFEGEPYLMPIYDSIDENVEKYWNMLNQENIISLLVKTIEISTGDVEIKIKNRHTS